MEYIRTEIKTLVQDKVTNEIARIACWSVRTLYQMGKTKQLVNEMKQYGIDIFGVSEVRWTGNGKMNLNTGEAIIHAGCEEKHRN